MLTPGIRDRSHWMPSYQGAIETGKRLATLAMAHSQRKLSLSLSVKAAPFLAAGGLAVAAGLPASHSTHDLSSRSTEGSAAWAVSISDPATVGCRFLPFYRLLPSIRPPSPYALCEGAKPSETESQNFERVLARHRSRISTYRKKWEYTADSAATTATKTPSRSWPDDVPSSDDLPWLLEDVKYCGRSPIFRSDEGYCDRLRFRVASALLVQIDEESQKRGLEMLRTLAERGHPDAMVYYGMCLNEGRANNAPDSDAAVSWFKRCADIHEHPQAQYELGVAFYTGEGVVEDEAEAVRLFRRASEQNHSAACYMLGDCLLDGIGVEIDRGLALEWLVRAADLGHRGARSRVMAVLHFKEGNDYGGFTDSSRQTLIEHTALSASKEGQLLQRKTTLRKTVGGSRDLAELARRQTITGKSREA